MEKVVFPEKTKYTYSVCAVVFGTDESILNIELVDGFHFVKKSIYSKADKLTHIFQTDVSGLQRTYINAFIYGCDDHSGDVICIEKEYDIELETSIAREYWDKANDNDIQSIDNQLRLIRLIKEAPVRVKQIAFNMNVQPYIVDETQIANNFCSIPYFSESYPTKPISRLHCSKKEIKTINNYIKTLSFPLEIKLLNAAHIYYDLSYHTEYCVSLTLLITSLEMIFLNKGDGKKEPLSKRCSSYIGETDQDISRIYKRLKETYKKRSDFVHEGDLIFIRETDVIFLRECVRNSLLKALENSETKMERIDKLKSFVKENDERLFG